MLRQNVIDETKKEFTILDNQEGNAEYIVQHSTDAKLKCSCAKSRLAGLPCHHEIFICRKLDLEPRTSLFFKQRWFLKYPEKMRERLYTAPDGIMHKHSLKDYSLMTRSQLEKLKTSNHPESAAAAGKDTARSTKHHQSKKSKKHSKRSQEDIVINS